MNRAVSAVVKIPAALRRALGIEPGDRLIARAEDDRLILERREAVVRRLRGRFREVAASGRGSVADELIAERRAEARREEE